MTGNIILCADDYALTSGVSRAIRMLAAANRISATSAIVTRANWRRDAEALKPLTNEIAVGLHLNLTLGAPLSSEWTTVRGRTFPSLKSLIIATHTGAIGGATFSNEIERQLDTFESGLGVPPDYVDGHEHVHVLPLVRAALIAILKRRYPERQILVRNPSPALARIFSGSVPWLKTLALRFMSRSMRRDAENAGLICNDRFSGLTDFEPTEAAVLRDFKDAASLEGWRPLAMCHPGFPDAELAVLDPITKRRQLEFDAMMAPRPLVLNLWRPRRTPNGQVQWARSQTEQHA